MVSERIQRQIDRFLDAAEEAAARFDWDAVRTNAEAVLRLDPQNADALTYLRAGSPATRVAQAPSPAVELPESFAGGRYQVTRLLGEGGKKRVYLAQDTRLDRDVAFALIKTEGLAVLEGE